MGDGPPDDGPEGRHGRRRRTEGPAGNYTVKYRVTGQDDHLIAGEIQFAIVTAFGQPAAAPEGGAAPPSLQTEQRLTAARHEGHAQESTSDGGGVPTWVAILGTIVVLGAGAGLIIGIRRRR